jgi:GT2 family glycosyltransferase
VIAAEHPHELPIVIVPVFNALDMLDACLASLDRTLPSAARVLVADDASTDPRIERLLEDWMRRTQLAAGIVVRERNLGFVGNVNRSFAESGDADVVLLNSDTVTTNGWLQRIAACAASDPRIATITPWSNNAEICSFPALCEDNPVPDDPDRIAGACASAGAPEYPELPTGVGFCMYIRRAALRQAGDFDAATFGRGYGEENDFCMRVAGIGWRNVLCDDAYVVHTGNASFGPLGERPGGENMRRLLARWPDYQQRVAEFILADPLRPLRDRIVRRLTQLQSPRAQSDLFD